MRAALALAALVALAGCGARTVVPDPYDPAHLAATADAARTLAREPVPVSPARRGFALPYALDRVYGTFGDCRPGGRQHRGLDLGGVGPHAGLGTPVRALVRAQITMIVRAGDDPPRYGRTDTRGGATVRSGVALPRQGVVPHYGTVHFFTRDLGAARTGVMIVTTAVGTELDGHRVRYMHLAAVHPELRVGDVVEAGQELGLMGGSAIMESLPHVHIDVETPDGVRVDIAPYLGLPADTSTCRGAR